jgi:hypothetical protein
MICGTDLIRLSIEKDVPYARLRAGIERGLDAYSEAVRPFLLYP